MFLSSARGLFAISVEDKVLVCFASSKLDRFLIIQNDGSNCEEVNAFSQGPKSDSFHPAAHNIGLASRLDLVDGKWLSAVCLSKDRHFLATANNSKVLRVYRLPSALTDGDAQMIHSWHLAKRTMAMTFVADNSGIVVADKLGDAYYYPFDQDVAKHQTPILGHISVLTDVVVTKDRRFILTADRDEKIRVSHFPLADDIQAFCLGHTEFISKITVPWQDRPIVISGSGDRSVRAFNFLTGAELGNISLLEDSDTTPTYVTSLEYSNDHEILFVSFFGMNRIFGIRVDIDTEASSVAFRKVVDIPMTHGNNPLPIRSLCIVETILVVICNDAEIPLRIYPDVFALISSNQESDDDLKSACTGVTEELKSLIRTAGDEKRLDSLFFDSLGQFFNEAQAEPFVDGDDVSSKKLRTTESV